MCADTKNMHLAMPLDCPEFMQIHQKIIPNEFLQTYNLHKKIKNSYVYLKIIRLIYGLPQVGILAIKLLQAHLQPYGYYEVTHTPGLWCHKELPVAFTLVVDDFGIKYTDITHAHHLLNALKQQYDVSVNWHGELCCRIKLKWNYSEPCFVDTSMPKYVPTQLTKFYHPKKNAHNTLLITLH